MHKLLIEKMGLAPLDSPLLDALTPRGLGFDSRCGLHIRLLKLASLLLLIKFGLWKLYFFLLICWLVKMGHECNNPNKTIYVQTGPKPTVP